MTTTKTIKITGQEILEHYVSVSENCTIAEARDIIKSAEIYYDVKKIGDIDRDNYEEILKEIEITYNFCKS